MLHSYWELFTETHLHPRTDSFIIIHICALQLLSGFTACMRWKISMWGGLMEPCFQQQETQGGERNVVETMIRNMTLQELNTLNWTGVIRLNPDYSRLWTVPWLLSLPVLSCLGYFKCTHSCALLWVLQGEWVCVCCNKDTNIFFPCVLWSNMTGWETVLILS